MKYFAAIAITLLPYTAQASVPKSYMVCLKAYANFSGFTSWLETKNEAPSPRIQAAYEADFEDFINMGIRQYGEAAIERAASTVTASADEDYIDTALSIYAVDGPEKTTWELADMFASCGGPNGKLRAALDH